jgi:spore germination protein KC
MKKFACLVLIVIVSCGLFTGCYDNNEIDEMAYVMAIGLDLGKTNTARVTIQFANPSAIGGGGEGGGGGGGEAVETMTVEAPSFYSALNMFNVSLSKELNISHAKVIVFSKELAEKDIGGYLNAFSRGRQFRPILNIVVSRTTAEDYIKSIKPVLETDPSKYYELNYTSYNYTGFTAEANLFKFEEGLKVLGRQPIAVLAGVNKYEKSEDFDKSGATNVAKGKQQTFEGDYKAGDVPREGGIKGEIMGLAVFNGPKMVGELDGEEATDLLMVTGEYKHSYITFPDPKEKKYFLILDVKQSRSPVYKVEIVDGKPKIHVKVILEADYLSIQSGIEYEALKNTNVFENSAQEFLKKGITDFLNKTVVLNSDICGFGNIAKRKFLLWKDWENFKWIEKYKDSTFTVDVDLKVRRTGLKIKTQPFVTTEGGKR